MPDLSFNIDDILIMVGRAVVPAVTDMNRGESDDKPSKRQKSRAKLFSTSVHSRGLVNLAYGEFDIRLMNRTEQRSCLISVFNDR